MTVIYSIDIRFCQSELKLEIHYSFIHKTFYLFFRGQYFHFILEALNPEKCSASITELTLAQFDLFYFSGYSTSILLLNEVHFGSTVPGKTQRILEVLFPEKTSALIAGERSSYLNLKLY
jgi:hypothetical protein